MDKVRIGILGAARIAPMAMVRPARAVEEAEVTAVAARDPKRAVRFAGKHRIPRVLPDYQTLIDDPDIDAVYNPLPNNLHCEWTLRALQAGKHVLCEKPLASNATEAEQIAVAAAAADRVVMEAFHYRYHPLAERMQEVALGGRLGAIERIETWMCVPLPIPGDIRYRYELAGGATMDVGSYAIHMLRTLAGGEPEVVAAEYGLSSPNVDRWMTARFRLPGGGEGIAHCSLFSSSLLRIGAHVTGERGSLRVFNPVAPQIYHRFQIDTPGLTKRWKFPRKATYTFQLEAFASAVLRGTPIYTPPADSLANMQAIDAVYGMAGLPVRGTTPA